ncbi:MAG: zinc-ribbon domain-containing protein, partial [Rhodovarius sp.]|nr:zinc-ribbon domain-containing protein [Rhodovarius sp.]
MRLACPACAATYEVPDALVGQGRQIRCARCGHVWFAAPAQAPAAPVAGTPTPAAEPAATPAPGPAVIPPA